MRWRAAAAWIVAVLGWWGATAWLARQEAPWAIRLTTPAFAAALALTYFAAWGVAVACARHGRRMRFRAAAITLSAALGVGVLEAPAAAGLLDYNRIRGALTGEWTGPSVDFIADHELSFRRPAHARWSGWPRSNMAQVFNLPLRSRYRQTFSTDGRGFRNAADLDRADVAIVGDSYVEGAYVSDEETVAARLHEWTGETVANLGVSGYGSLQELKILERYALPLGPRLVAWFFFEGNDFDDDQAYENAMAYERGVPAPRTSRPMAVKWREFLDRSLTANAFMELRALADPLVPNAVDSFGWFRDRGGATRRFYFFDFYATREFGSYEQERFEAAQAAWRRGSTLCRDRGIRLIVFYVPIKFRVYGDFCTFPPGSPCTRWHSWDLEARFTAFCRDAGIECVSLTGPMRRAAAAGEVVYAPEDSHWSADGHRLVARIVRDAAVKPLGAP